LLAYHPRSPKENLLRYQRIDLNLLVALDVLLAEQNVTRAAERMHITQSAMSGVLARLREYFDDPLLVPVGRSLRPTPRAERLVQPVRDIILRIDSTIGADPDFDPATARRHFVIIASDYVTRVLLADVICAMAADAPGLSFEIQPTSVQMGAALDQGQVDLLVTPAHLTLAAHPQAHLFEDSYHVIAWTGHAELDGGLDLAAYQALGHVVYLQDPQGLHPWFEQWYANEHGATRRVEVVTNGFTLMPRFIVGTRRIATVQTRLARQFVRELPVRMIEPPMDTPRLTEMLQWHSYRDTDPALQWVRGRIVAAAQALPPL
jgi:LysR family transcriptional regulator, nod-box dependent transcriptional activator